MLIRQLLFIVFFTFISVCSFSQIKDSSKAVYHFSGTGSITNNGISLIPSFSLGKPALLMLMSLGGKRLSIDPDIRFSLQGKPWTFVFNARYKLLNKGRVSMITGVNLGLNFRETLVHISSVPTKNMIARRYLGLELNSSYLIAKNISVGNYYLYSRGIDNGTIKNTHFFTVNGNFSHIRILREMYMRLNSQFYYLNQNGKDGLFFSPAFTLYNGNFPLAVSSILNKTIVTNIPGNKAFIWNLGLMYTFNKHFVQK
jgi:hypothetical protein